jgi:hypothetical protein
MGLIPLGILSSAGGSLGAYELIETQILGSAATSITFSGLSSYQGIYRHLQIRGVAAQTIVDNGVAVRVNGDGGSNYAQHFLYGQGSSVASGAGTSRAQMALAYNQDSNGSLEPSVFVFDLLDAFGNKNKTFRSLSGVAAGSSKNIIWLGSGLWNSTATLTSVSVSAISGTNSWQTGNFRANSRFSLYGIR